MLPERRALAHPGDRRWPADLPPRPGSLPDRSVWRPACLPRHAQPVTGCGRRKPGLAPRCRTAPAGIVATLAGGVQIGYRGSDPDDPDRCLLDWSGRSHPLYFGLWSTGPDLADERRRPARRSAPRSPAQWAPRPRSRCNARSLWKRVYGHPCRQHHHRRRRRAAAALELRVVRHDAAGRPEVRAETRYTIDRATGVLLRSAECHADGRRRGDDDDKLADREPYRKPVDGIGPSPASSRGLPETPHDGPEPHHPRQSAAWQRPFPVALLLAVPAAAVPRLAVGIRRELRRTRPCRRADVGRLRHRCRRRSASWWIAMARAGS